MSRKSCFQFLLAWLSCKYSNFKSLLYPFWCFHGYVLAESLGFVLRVAMISFFSGKMYSFWFSISSLTTSPCMRWRDFLSLQRNLVQFFHEVFAWIDLSPLTLGFSAKDCVGKKLHLGHLYCVEPLTSPPSTYVNGILAPDPGRLNVKLAECVWYFYYEKATS